MYGEKEPRPTKSREVAEMLSRACLSVTAFGLTVQLLAWYGPKWVMFWNRDAYMVSPLVWMPLFAWAAAGCVLAFWRD